MWAPNGYLHAASLIVLGGYLRRLRDDGAPGRRRENFTTVELKSNFLGTRKEGIRTECGADDLGRTTHVWSATCSGRAARSWRLSADADDPVLTFAGRVSGCGRIAAGWPGSVSDLPVLTRRSPSTRRIEMSWSIVADIEVAAVLAEDRAFRQAAHLDLVARGHLLAVDPQRDDGAVAVVEERVLADCCRAAGRPPRACRSG